MERRKYTAAFGRGVFGIGRVRTLLLLVVFAFGAAACAPKRTTPAAPEAAFRTFRATLRGVARGGPGDAAWALLGPQTRARLEERASAARAAGQLDATPASMLEVAWAAYATDIDSVETLTSDDRGARLRVATHNGQRWIVDAGRGETGWYFELPQPGQLPTPEISAGSNNE